MAVCAKTLQQQDGTLLLALDPAQTNLATCAYVVETGTASGWRELGELTVADANVIGTYVGVVWAVAWAFRAIGKSIFLNESSQND